MKKIALTATAIALALGATAAQAAPATQKFQCQNGITLTVKKAGTDKISVYANTIGKRVVLKQAPSGSGNLYEADKGFYGNETELHIKGKQAFFSFEDPHGNDVETSCRSR
ncbi:MliC family protein [Alysiella filiformis]|uniref:Membrane-bound inhibitor of C-type lysozyme n=1 Tax=Alysiella filiformis DSM 16848 TaxID=1120981 RepID=A0A286EF48_9NEIS|nr:MliC family protein [Alysiella filiformis]QMT31753.1 MliC family protein [Alysiella filiformis]UBQ55235.1 MliC family protein [Alysiella filiformis DSM 16848]SOD69527.1 Membrane-bound inhibitor of C-type lysozyme [Alysiella filiformis DSM 16848]